MHILVLKKEQQVWWIYSHLAFEKMHSAHFHLEAEAESDELIILSVLLRLDLAEVKSTSFIGTYGMSF